jgi:hypothetical protein
MRDGDRELPPLPPGYEIAPADEVISSVRWLWAYPGAPCWQLTSCKGEKQPPSNVYAKPKETT